MTELTDRDLAIRAIEAYLTWTPRDRRREIAGYIYEALKKLGYLSPERVEEREKHWAEMVFKLLCNLRICNKDATPTVAEVEMALSTALKGADK